MLSHTGLRYKSTQARQDRVKGFSNNECPRPAKACARLLVPLPHNHEAPKTRRPVSPCGVGNLACLAAKTLVFSLRPSGSQSKIEPSLAWLSAPIRSGMSLGHTSALRAAARWICHDCRSRLRPNQIPKQRNLSSSALVQSRLLRDQSPTKIVLPNFQRRRQSERSNDRVENLRDDLPSRMEGRRSDAAKRFSHLMDHLQSNIFIAGQRLNDLTGYSGIEALKKDIESQGQS